MGRDLLAEDYLLKQITASLIYPESQLGKEFWQKVYAQAQVKYGTTNIPINTFNKVYNDDIRLYQWFSGNTYAYPEYNSNTALHTMALYMTKYIGTVTIQGTLYNTPAAFGRYVTINTLTYNGRTGIDYINFNGIFSYVRVIYQPALGPTDYNNDNTDYSGTFDKVLYRS